MDVSDSVPVRATRGRSWRVPQHEQLLRQRRDRGRGTVLAAFPQSMYSTVNVVLDSAAGFDTLKKAVAADPTLMASVKTEADANEAVTSGLRNVLNFVSYFIGSLNGARAVCGA